jgi:hypothetical protein
MTSFQDLFYCYDCNTTRHYRDCTRDHCETVCADTHLCTCGNTLVRPQLTAEQREDLIRCGSTRESEAELYLSLQKLSWMNNSTYILAACDHTIHSEGFPQCENLIHLFAEWHECQEASQHIVSSADIRFLNTCMDAMDICTDEMQKSILFGTLFQYLMDHPAILYRSKHFRNMALSRAVDIYVFASKQKRAMTTVAEQEGGVMDSDRYDRASELQDITFNFLALPVFG